VQGMVVGFIKKLKFRRAPSQHAQCVLAGSVKTGYAISRSGTNKSVT